MGATVEWKPWYAAEVESDAGRRALRAAIDATRDPKATDSLASALEGGGLVSFPHTRLEGSAVPLARTAAAIVDGAFDRVVALGVLHGSSLPEPERAIARAAAQGDVHALERVGGAFVATDAVATPFGTAAAGPAPATGSFVRPGDALLAREFSLDLFLAALVAVATDRGRPAPAVTRLFVGPTRAGESDTSAADAVARAVRGLLGPRVACVATGDLVHAGHGYSSPAEIAALPTDPERLVAHFEPRVRRMLADAFRGGDAPRRADAEALALRNDQRHLLPVLARVAGPGASPRLESFALTDYGDVLGEPSPCVVASALVSVAPAA